jgi:hypothetical protein
MSTPPNTVAQVLQADRLNFPGMLPREILVFRSWLRLHESEYTRFDYNYRIGTGFDPGPSVPESIRTMAIQNSQKRIDAVAYQDGKVTLIEVKDRAGFSAVGQLVGYLHLWQNDHPNDPAPRLLLVCNRTQEDIGLVANRAGIDIELVEADFSPLAGVRARRQR